jgi:two-component system sensor histidine kinase UhpB
MATTAQARLGRVAKKRPIEKTSVRVASFSLLLIVIGILFLLARDQADAVADRTLLLWAGLVFAASIWPVGEQEGSPYLALDLPILLACAFANGPLAAGLVALLATVSRQELRGRMSVSRSLFNHSQVALSVIAAGTVYRAIGGNPIDWPQSVVAAELALIADSTVNYLAVALLYALALGRRPGSVLKDLHLGDPTHFAVFYAGLGLAAAVMATLYVLAGPVALLALVAVVVLAREALSQTLKAANAARDLAARREALKRVDERIAEERADERSRIAGALHDEVLQSIFDVTIRAHVIRECYRRGQLLQLEEEVPDLVAASERIADELREVIHGLRQSSVGLGGLVDSIALLIRHLRDQSGIRFVEDLDVTARLDERAELAAYQVAREALGNACRHSSADTVWISLLRTGGGVELRVLDNGCGFDASKRREKHFGLELMGERVRNAGGEFELRSAPGEGVLVVVWFDT